MNKKPLLVVYYNFAELFEALEQRDNANGEGPVTMIDFAQSQDLPQDNGLGID